jgi:hypothetical protein
MGDMKVMKPRNEVLENVKWRDLRIEGSVISNV